MKPSPTPPPPRSLLRMREAARQLAVSESTVRRLIRTGLLPRVKLLGAVRVDQVDLDRLVRDGHQVET